MISTIATVTVTMYYTVTVITETVTTVYVNNSYCTVTTETAAL